MIAASVLGVPVTAALAAACRAFLAGVADAAAWSELAPLVEAAEQHGISLRAAASCALGTACAVCGMPIESGGLYKAAGWVHGEPPPPKPVQISLF